MVYEWISGARAVDEKWKRDDQVMAFIQRADQVGYVGRNKKAT